MYVNVYWSHSFLRDLIRPESVVFDFGVYDGGFARVVAPYCARVVGFEADPSWNGKLSLPSNVRVVPKALAAERGTIEFYVNSELCSSLHYSETGSLKVDVDAVTLEDALNLEPNGTIDLVKMDIEGEEVPILLAAPAVLFDRIAQMTVEFHDFLDPRSVPAIRAVILRLRKLGFYAICFSFRSLGDVLFLNKKLIPLTIWQRVWLVVRYKYLRGLMRLIKRSVVA